MKRGICFSGGGIKCAAHIGVVKACEENNIEFDYISGTSSGSIITVLYALGYTADEMYEILKKHAKEIGYVQPTKVLKLIFDLLVFRKIKIDGLNNGNRLEKIVNKICKNKGVNKINEIKKPIFIPAVDVCDGKVYIFSSQKNNKFMENINYSDNKNYINNKEYFENNRLYLYSNNYENNRQYSDNVIYENNIEICKAIRASCSYPGIFTPFKYNTEKLIDGGIRENVPWKELENTGAEEIWGVTFSKKMKNECNKNIFGVIGDSIGILCHELSNYELYGMKQRINVELDDVDLLDYKKIDYIYKKGYEQAQKFIKEYKVNKI